MADRYWVNGTGNWSSTGQWSASPGGSSGASVPTFTDNVIFDRAATYSVTIDVSTRSCNDITVSAGTVTFIHTFALSIYGSLSYIAGVVHSGTGAATINFSSTTTGKTITTNGTSFSNIITFNGSGGGWTLGSSLTTTNTCNFNAGTLNLNGFTLTSASVQMGGTITRQINFGAANWVMSGSQMQCNTVTGFSWTGTGGMATAMTSFNKTFSFGAAAGADATNAINLTLTSGTYAANIVPGSWYNTFDASASAGTVNGIFAVSAQSTALNVGNIIFAAGRGMNGSLTTVAPGNVSINSVTNFTVNHNGTTKLLAPITVSVSGSTGSLTLTSGTLDLNGQTLTTRFFSGTGSTARSIAFGASSIVLNGTTAAANYLDMADATNFTQTGSGGFTAAADITRTFTFGTTGGTSNNAPSLALTSGASIPTLTTGSYFNHLNFTGSTCTPAVTSLNLNSLTLASGGTYTNLTPTMVGTGNVSTAGNSTLPALIINNVSGITTLISAATLTATSTATLTSGNLSLGGFTLTPGIFSSNGTSTRAISFGANNIVLAHSTAATGVLDMADATNFTRTGSGGFTSAMSVARTFTFGTTGGSTTNAPNLSLTSGASIPTITAGSWFNKLDFTGSTSIPA